MLSLNTCVPLLKKRKRVGRGGKLGGTSGKGHKGQKARTSGTVGAIFEGGQMPLSRRLPKRGFNNTRFADTWVVVNLKQLNAAFDNGAEITKEVLLQQGVVKIPGKARLKVLGTGSLEKKLFVQADAFSKSAVQSIESQGGEVRIIKKG